MSVAEPVAVPAEDKPKDAMASISGQLTVLSGGEHALLRRMFLTNKPAADGVVVKLLHAAGLERQDYSRDYEAWRLVAHAAALLSGTGRQRAHDGRRGLGLALQEAGVSENRLMRLTAARGEALRDQIVLAARIVAQAGAGPVNLWALLHLAQGAGALAERTRIRIAQDYYAARARQEGGTK